MEKNFKFIKAGGMKQDSVQKNVGMIIKENMIKFLIKIVYVLFVEKSLKFRHIGLENFVQKIVIIFQGETEKSVFVKIAEKNLR